MTQLVGHVQALWRYPVKSMLGERLPRLEVEGPLAGPEATPLRLRSDDPNLLIDTAGAEGFVEQAWEGGTLAIGDQLRLQVEGGCPRCVITTLAQGDLPETLEILRATARHNQVTAGIRLSVLEPGPVAVGDPVRWTPA